MTPKHPITPRLAPRLLVAALALALTLTLTAGACREPAAPLVPWPGDPTDVPGSDAGRSDSLGGSDAAVADTGGDTGADSDAAADTRAADAGPAQPDPALIRIATFNVRRFFDDTCDTGVCGDGAYEDAPSTAVFNARAAQLARAVAGLDADIVLLQEVESQRCMDALGERLDGGPFPVAVLGETGAPASVDVAVLATGRFRRTVRHRGQALPLPGGGTTRFAREFLEVHVEIAGWPVIVFVAHFKSKSDDDPTRRLAEATAAADIVRAAAAARPDALVVFGGDLNDTPGSPPLLAIDERDLTRVAADLPADDQWTYTFFGSHQAIDHLYLAPTPVGALEPGSIAVQRDNEFGYGGSDHAALTATFRVAAPSPAPEAGP